MYEPMKVQMDFTQKSGLGTKESTGVLDNPAFMTPNSGSPHFPVLMPPSPSKPADMPAGTPLKLTEWTS